MFERGISEAAVRYAIDKGEVIQEEEVTMKCVICKHGETQEGTATVTLERTKVTIVFKDVPAQVCANCGEEYIDSLVTQQLLRSAEEAEKSGVEVDVRHYKAA